MATKKNKPKIDMKVLDRVTDKVLAFKPKSKKKSAGGK